MIENVPFSLGIAVERVEDKLMTLRENSVAVADHEERPHGPSLASLHA